MCWSVREVHRISDLVIPGVVEVRSSSKRVSTSMPKSREACWMLDGFNKRHYYCLIHSCEALCGSLKFKSTWFPLTEVSAPNPWHLSGDTASFAHLPRGTGYTGAAPDCLSDPKVASGLFTLQLYPAPIYTTRNEGREGSVKRLWNAAMQPETHPLGLGPRMRRISCYAR